MPMSHVMFAGGVMATREEIRRSTDRRSKIREGMFNIVREADDSALPEVEWEYALVDNLREYLHSQGLALKVDRELPRLLVDADKAQTVRDTKEMMIKAGYEATESLI